MNKLLIYFLIILTHYPVFSNPIDLKSIINVQNFNILPKNNATINTKNLQKLLNLETQIYFPKGIYKIDTKNNSLLFNSSIIGDNAIIRNINDTNYAFKFNNKNIKKDINLYTLKIEGIELQSKFGFTFNTDRYGFRNAKGEPPLKGFSIKNSVFKGKYNESLDSNSGTNKEVKYDSQNLPYQLESYGIAIKCSKCFGTVIDNCLFTENGIAIAYYGSDINTLTNSRFERNARNVNDYRSNTFGSQNEVHHNDILRTKRVGGIFSSSKFTKISYNYFENGKQDIYASRFIQLEGKLSIIKDNRFDSPGAHKIRDYPYAIYFGNEASSYLEGNIWNHSGKANILYATNYFKPTKSFFYTRGGKSALNNIFLGNNNFNQIQFDNPRFFNKNAIDFYNNVLKNQQIINLNIYGSFRYTDKVSPYIRVSNQYLIRLKKNKKIIWNIYKNMLLEGHQYKLQLSGIHKHDNITIKVKIRANHKKVYSFRKKITKNNFYIEIPLKLKNETISDGFYLSITTDNQVFFKKIILK